MVTFNELIRQRDYLRTELYRSGNKVTPKIKMEIDAFLKELGQKFIENNELIAKNPSNPRVDKLKRKIQKFLE